MNFLGILFVSLIASIPLVNYTSEGKYCVNATVQPGDLIQIPDGSIMQVVEVEGPSIFCRNPELPNKAVAQEQKHQR